MTTMSDQEFAETETRLRQGLARLADLAPTAVHMPDEIQVVGADRPMRNRRRIGVIAAVTALVGAGSFTTYSFLGASSHGGAATPQEAVTTFVDAIDHEDLVGMIDVTVPEEVGVLRASIDSITADAKRIGLLGESFDSSGVRGVDISIGDLTLDTNFLEGGLAVVTATGGTLNTSFDPQSFPFGDKVRALIGESPHAEESSSTLGLTEPPALLMTVERDGRWYVSVEYTIAEYARRAANWDMPGAVTRTPVGFDSPDAAATAFFDRLSAFDLQGALDTFAPGEDAMAWLAQSWLADADAALERGRADGWSVAVSGLTYETIGEGQHLTLKPLAFKVDGTVPAHFAQQALETTATDPQPFTIERSDGCTSYLGVGAQSIFGDGSSSPLAKPLDGGYQICGDSASLGSLGMLLLLNGVADLPPVSVVQNGDKWYVSPLGTALASATISLHEIGDGSSLFDSALAPFIYGGASRPLLEASVAGQNADAIDPACLPALTVDNGVVTGVAADPPLDAVRACQATLVFGGEVSSSGSGIAPATPAPVPVVEGEPATTVP